MTLPVTVSVRAADGHVHSLERDLASLSFRKLANGGTASILLDVRGDAARPPTALTPGGVVEVYDRATRELICDADLTDPGVRSEHRGVWQSTALGWRRRLLNPARPYVYVDREMAKFIRADNVLVRGQHSLGEDPLTSGVESAIMLQIPNGTAVVTDSRVVVRYHLYRVTGQYIARVDYHMDAARTHADLRAQLVMRGAFTPTVARNNQFDTGGAGADPKRLSLSFPTDAETLDLRILWQGGALTIADDVTYATFRSFYVQGVRYKIDGTLDLDPANYPANAIAIETIVADVAGRLLDVDPALSSLGATGEVASHLAYDDPATGERILDDCLTYTGDRWRYTLTNRSRTTGKPGLLLLEWDDEPRYIVHPSAGRASLELPETSIVGEVLVRYITENGGDQAFYVTRTQTTDSRLGEPQQHVLDLSNEAAMSESEAQALGDDYLAARRVPKAAGTLTVTGRVYDRTLRRWVQPHQLEPGELYRVADIDVDPGTLSRAGRDGRSTFRGISMDYRDGVASIALDAQPYDGESEIHDRLKLLEQRRRR